MTYEPGGLHEHRADGLNEINVIMPKLVSPEGCSFVAAEIQKYTAKDGRLLWRSFTRYRSVFRDGYTSREVCAQEVVRDCPSVVEAIGWRKRRLSQDGFEIAR